MARTSKKARKEAAEGHPYQVRAMTLGFNLDMAKSYVDTYALLTGDTEGVEMCKFLISRMQSRWKALQVELRVRQESDSE